MGKHPYGRKFLIRDYSYRVDPKLGKGVVSVKIIPYVFHSCQKQLFIPWGPKIKYLCNKSRYTRALICKYSQIMVSYNNWIILNFIDEGKYCVDYEHINVTILDGNVANIFWSSLKQSLVLLMLKTSHVRITTL